MTVLNEVPKVSVCCAYYNRSESLPAMLDSLLAQTNVSFEIVIVNDGSPDPRVKEILDTYSDSRLNVIHQENQGFVRSIKTAISHSRGQYIAIQGAGDLSFPARLSRQAAVMDNDAEVGIVGCRRYNTVVGGPENGATVESCIIKRQPELNDLLYGENPFSHGEVMFRRSLYNKVGGYREFFRFAQDRDLWIRMAKYCKMHAINDILYQRHMFVADGIATDREKLLLQQALSSFARQCHHDRERYGKDYIDMYGVHGGLFRRPAVAYANYIAGMALQSLYCDDGIKAIYFAQRAWNEKKAIKPLITQCLIFLCTRSVFMKKIFILIRSRNKNAKLWAAKQ